MTRDDSKEAQRPENWGKRVVVLANGVPVQRVPISLARRFHQICTAVATEVASQEGLTALQLGALTYLRRQSSMSQNDLAARLGVERSNTSLLLDQLEQRGLIERTANPSDRREKLVRLTPQGQTTRERLRPKGGMTQASILDPLEPNDRERFLDMLIKIIDAKDFYVRPGVTGESRPRDDAKSKSAKGKK